MKIQTQEVTVKYENLYYKRIYFCNTKNALWFTDNGDYVNEEKTIELNKAYSECLKLEKINE
jgi:hypothetical protein